MPDLNHTAGMMLGNPKLLESPFDTNDVTIIIRTIFGKLLFPDPYADL